MSFCLVPIKSNRKNHNMSLNRVHAHESKCCFFACARCSKYASNQKRVDCLGVKFL